MEIFSQYILYVYNSYTQTHTYIMQTKTSILIAIKHLTALVKSSLIITYGFRYYFCHVIWNQLLDYNL